jgi:signal transduction histidine kinase
LIAIGAVALPYSIAVLVLARRAPSLALSPLVAVADLALLAAAEVASPATYGAVRFLALFLVAAHAHFQGEARGVLMAVLTIVVLTPLSFLTDTPVDGGLRAFYELLFATCTLAAGFFMGRLRTAESTGRLRARELSRRALEAEGKMRRDLAEAIHDGPVQELVSLDMMIDAARRAVERGDGDRAEELLAEARTVTERNIGALRDEIVGLGPYAMDELTLDVALHDCAPMWGRRFGIDIHLDVADVDLSNDLCGALFGIAQEAVSNAGRHAEAEGVWITVKPVDDHIELRVRDDGRGFGDDQRPLGPTERGHIGLATMRERAELAGGKLQINTSSSGTTVLVRAPLSPADEVNGGRPAASDSG